MPSYPPPSPDKPCLDGTLPEGLNVNGQASEAWEDAIRKQSGGLSDAWMPTEAVTKTPYTLRDD
jgi:hypothetical protein